MLMAQIYYIGLNCWLDAAILEVFVTGYMKLKFFLVTYIHVYIFLLGYVVKFFAIFYHSVLCLVILWHYICMSAYVIMRKPKFLTIEKYTNNLEKPRIFWSNFVGLNTVMVTLLTANFDMWNLHRDCQQHITGGCSLCNGLIMYYLYCQLLSGLFRVQ